MIDIFLQPKSWNLGNCSLSVVLLFNTVKLGKNRVKRYTPEALGAETKFLQTQNQHPLKSTYQGLKKFHYDLDVIYQMSSVVESPEKKNKKMKFSSN